MYRLLTIPKASLPFGTMPTTIHDLPEELLSIIFELALEGKDWRFSSWRAQLALVSRSWNAIVQHSPCLWSRICDDQSLELNTLALIRSGNAPINIRFSFDYFTERRLLSATDSFRTTCRHVRRWRTARLTFGDERRSNSDLYELFTTPAPLLEQLTIEYTGCLSMPLITNPFAGQADRLRSICIHGACIPWNSGILFDLDTLKLHDIENNPPTLSNILSILQSSPTLSVLELSGLPFDPMLEQTPEHPPIQLPRLRSLYLGGLDYRFQSILLQHMQAPPCEQLTLQYAPDEDVNAISFISLIRPFIPRTVSSTDAVVNLEIGRNNLGYTLSSPPCYLSIGIDGPHISTILTPFFSILSSDLLDLDTYLILGQDIPFDEAHAVLPLADTGRVVGLNMYTHNPAIPNIILESMAEPGQDGTWFFPTLQKLIIDSDEVTPGLVSRMVHARYGLASSTQRLPLPFTNLAIYRSGCSRSEREVIESIVGKDVWGQRNG